MLLNCKYRYIWFDIFAITAHFEQLGMYECPKELRSEMWARDEGPVNSQRNTVAFFDDAWDRHMKAGHRNDDGAWMPAVWGDPRILQLSVKMQIYILAAFPLAFPRERYEDIVLQRKPVWSEELHRQPVSTSARRH